MWKMQLHFAAFGDLYLGILCILSRLEAKVSGTPLSDFK